tara:strand:+ start:279 stop:1121 length:843 start_codon:yes stop_codon:yes gene_type:complete
MIIWLASYPKSGNTWVRSIISSLIFTKDGNFNFNLIKNIKQFPIKEQFKQFTTKFRDFNEIKKYWMLAQETLNLDNKIKFLKTHHLNCKIGDYSFTNKNNTLATIYIVRDPRNLVNSIANHFSFTQEESKKFLFSPGVLSGNKYFGESNKESLPVFLGTWNEHYKFWKNKNKDYLLIKYEELVSQPEIELEKIIKFLGKYMPIETNNVKNSKIIENTSFEKLQNLEKMGTFKENAFQSPKVKQKFFHLGPENNWKKQLDNKIKNEIELKFESEMRELGYL